MNKNLKKIILILSFYPILNHIKASDYCCTEKVETTAHFFRITTNRLDQTMFKYFYIFEKKVCLFNKWKSQFVLFEQYQRSCNDLEESHSQYRFFRWLKIAIKKLKSLKCSLEYDLELIDRDLAFEALSEKMNWLKTQLQFLNESECLAQEFEELISDMQNVNDQFRESHQQTQKLISEIEDFNNVVLATLDKLTVKCCCSF